MVKTPQHKPKPARLLIALLSAMVLLSMPGSAQSDEQGQTEETQAETEPEQAAPQDAESSVTAPIWCLDLDPCPYAYFSDWIFEPTVIFAYCHPQTNKVVHVVNGWKWLYVGYFDGSGDFNVIEQQNYPTYGTRNTAISCVLLP